MAGERGQRTTLVFGGVAVDVSLSKASAKPKDAAHDVRRMIGDELAEVARERALAAFAPWVDVALTTEPLTEQRWAVADDALADERTGPSGETVWRDAPDPFADLPPERVEQGVLLESGEFVDLTDRLAEIDERTRVEGMEVLATIASSSVPRTRVRDAHWIGLAPGSSSGAKVLAILWRALRQEDAAAVVRWTKRTNQAVGIVVPTGAMGRGAALCLLELEWAANLRAPGPRACAPLDVEVSDRELGAARRLVEALHRPASFVDGLHDERAVKRAELLGAARDGTLDRYTPPAKPKPTVAGVDVADALEAAASR
jgi:non-homologous end joining protein Ku